MAIRKVNVKYNGVKVADLEVNSLNGNRVQRVTFIAETQDTTIGTVQNYLAENEFKYLDVVGDDVTEINVTS